MGLCSIKEAEPLTDSLDILPLVSSAEMAIAH